MEDRSEQRPEAVFEVVWHQRGPEDRRIEVTDLCTGRRRRVDSVEGLIRFIESCLREASAPPEHRERGGRNLNAPER